MTTTTTTTTTSTTTTTTTTGVELNNVWDTASVAISLVKNAQGYISF